MFFIPSTALISNPSISIFIKSILKIFGFFVKKLSSEITLTFSDLYENMYLRKKDDAPVFKVETN